MRVVFLGPSFVSLSLDVLLLLPPDAFFLESSLFLEEMAADADAVEASMVELIQDTDFGWNIGMICDG